MERYIYLRTVVSMSCQYKNPTKRVGLLQSRHHFMEMQIVLAMILLNNCLYVIKQQSLYHSSCYFGDLIMYKSSKNRHTNFLSFTLLLFLVMI